MIDAKFFISDLKLTLAEPGHNEKGRSMRSNPLKAFGATRIRSTTDRCLAESGGGGRLDGWA